MPPPPGWRWRWHGDLQDVAFAGAPPHPSRKPGARGAGVRSPELPTQAPKSWCPPGSGSPGRASEPRPGVWLRALRGWTPGWAERSSRRKGQGERAGVGGRCPLAFGGSSRGFRGCHSRSLSRALGILLPHSEVAGPEPKFTRFDPPGVPRPSRTSQIGSVPLRSAAAWASALKVQREPGVVRHALADFGSHTSVPGWSSPLFLTLHPGAPVLQFEKQEDREKEREKKRERERARLFRSS